MIALGLTGGVGMGKSAAAQFFRQAGVAVVDTDVLAREVVQPGQPAWHEIRQAFGESVIDPDGQVRRQELARLVFADEVKRRELEAIVHPRVRERWLAAVAAWRATGIPCGLVVVPLLFETNAAPRFDRVVCVACSAPTQRERLVARGWDDRESDRRIAAQWPIERKMQLSDHVLWSEGTLDVLRDQVTRILRTLRVG
ncbi:MAG TPA: dephospho-CoA kinase [Methylomirabilota bacterium]|nr:dephospho-CoA kinase [Methylomirabilota bacterium]